MKRSTIDDALAYLAELEKPENKAERERFNKAIQRQAKRDNNPFLAAVRIPEAKNKEDDAE